MSVGGSIYYKPAFEFSDGGISDKLIVLLNTPSKNDNYLFVPTTSQKKIRSKTPGCVKNYGGGEFFLPVDTTGLNCDTWIILAEIYPVASNTIKKDSNFNRLREVTLSSKLMDKVIDCLFKHHGDDIPEMYEPLIRPKINDWKQQLSGKFNRK